MQFSNFFHKGFKSSKKILRIISVTLLAFENIFGNAFTFGINIPRFESSVSLPTRVNQTCVLHKSDPGVLTFCSFDNKCVNSFQIYFPMKCHAFD